MKLLFVEDDVNQAELFARLLGKLFAGNQFESCAKPTLAQAIMVVEEFDPDMIFLDLKLSDSPDWRETLKVIHGPFAKYPVFVLTGIIDPTFQIMAESFRAGARGFFLKPFLTRQRSI